MPSLVNSSFNALPVKLKIGILQLLKHRDIKSARLVCTYWFRLLGFICPPEFSLVDNQSQPLQSLKKSFLHSIENLGVKNYTESLPICTSTRYGIPKTKILELYYGNSVENIMKLLRNYAKSCERLLLAHCFYKLVEPFRLKGLAYDSLRSLEIWFQLPTNGWGCFGERNHLIALTQFLKTTKLPNLQEFNTCRFGGLNENSTVQKFNQALISFFERCGQQLTKLTYFYIIPSVLVNSLKYLCNLEDFSIQFCDDVPIHNLNETRESFKHIKKLTSLTFCIDPFEIVAFQPYSELMCTMLKENREIQKFILHCNLARMDWIPVDCELGLKEIELQFQQIGQNLFTQPTIIPNLKLKSVSKLSLHISYHNSQPFLVNISCWIIATFPNLRNLIFNIPSAPLKVSHCRLLICNLVYLKKFFLVNGYRRIEDETRDWLAQQNEGEFIKSIPFNGELEISISRPFPNNIFDGHLL